MGFFSIDARGIAPGRRWCERWLYYLLNVVNVRLKSVGTKWVYNYIQRTPDLATRFSRRYEYRRALCEDPATIREWFDNVQQIIIQYGILAEDTYNFDETGSAMGHTRHFKGSYTR